MTILYALEKNIYAMGCGCLINVIGIHLIDSGFIFLILPHTTPPDCLLVLAVFERVLKV